MQISIQNTRGLSARFARRRRGNAMIEAALVLPVLMYLVFGCVDFGQMIYIKHTLQGAAREGARAAATPGSNNGDVTTAVNNSMSAAGFVPAKYTLKIRDANDTTNLNVNQTAGTPIQVRVEANWSNVGVQMTRFISPTKIIAGATTMRKEG